MDDAIPVSTRLRRSTPYHDAYTVRVYDARFAALATARPADARRWVATTRWLHGGLLYRGRLIVGLGVQWTPPRAPLRGDTPVPATLQLCVGHRCLVFHLARADAVPETLRRFLADPRITFVGSGAAHDARMLWDHYGLDVALGKELRAAAGMGNASVEQMADRFLGYPGICKPRDVAMSAWHAPRLSLDQVQYASVDAYLAFRLGVVLLCPGAAAVPPSPPARAQQRAPVHHRVPAVINPAAPRALVAVHAAPPVQRAPAVVRRQALAPVVDIPTVFVVPQEPAVQRAPAVVRRQALAPVVDIPTVFVVPQEPAAPVVDVPTIFVRAPVTAVGGDAAITTGSKVRCTHAGVTDDSDTESEMDSYDDVLYRAAATRGLPVRAYASDSDYSLDSPDGYVRFGAFTDEEDEDDDSNEDDDEEGCDEDDQEDCNEGNQTDEEGCNEDHLEVGEGLNQNDGEGLNQNDDEGYNNEDDQEGYNYTNGAGSAELVSGGEVVIDGCVQDDALAQDGWYDQDVDYGFHQEVDFGCDQDDEQEEFEEFYLL